MMRAALARNAVRAVQLMTDHIGRTNERVAKTLGAMAATQPIRACKRQSVT
jgi:DNA-binding GntR family transcriptional regulator